MRTILLAAVFALAANAAKTVSPVTSEDEYLVVEALAHLEKESVAEVLGHDPGMELIVVQVKLAPRGETKIKIDLDDFTLISRKDGQRSQPLAPSQIAGAGALVVNSGTPGRAAGGVFKPNRGPLWGGMPGTGSRPQRIGGEGESAAITTSTATEATLKNDRKASENPVLDSLKLKALPLKETNEPVTGLIYFFLEGKHKLKQLELMYKSPGGRMVLDFEK